MKNLLLLFLLLGVQNLWAQDVYTSSGKPVNRPRKTASNNDGGFDKDKMIYGGTIQLNYGNVYDYSGNPRGTSFIIGASPTAGYHLTEDFMAGVGIGYLYQSISEGLVNPQTGQVSPQRNHWVYPSIWARYGVFENVFLQAEYAYNLLFYNALKYDPSGSGNIIKSYSTASASTLLLGGGLRQRISDRSSILVGIFYNVLGNSNQEFNPYPGNLVFRTGISIGY